MPYKPTLLTALYSDYEDAARKYMTARDDSAEMAEQYLRRMKTIAHDIEYTHRMIDGTMGKAALQRGAHKQDQALAAALPGIAGEV